MITLKPVDRDNFYLVLKLSVSETQQELVAPNIFSLAQAYAFQENTPLAAYAGDTPVGFAMYCLGDTEDGGQTWINRVMIDQRHQGKGCGRALMEALIRRIRRENGGRTIFLSFEPENQGARRLYEKLGFVPDGRVVEGEIVYRLEPENTPGPGYLHVLTR